MKRAADPVLARTPLKNRRFSVVPPPAVRRNFWNQNFTLAGGRWEGGKRAKNRRKNDIFMGPGAGFAPWE
jgi:hypothetical protein